jgi:hypothetical protein
MTSNHQKEQEKVKHIMAGLDTQNPPVEFECMLILPNVAYHTVEEIPLSSPYLCFYLY